MLICSYCDGEKRLSFRRQKGLISKILADRIFHGFVFIVGQEFQLSSGLNFFSNSTGVKAPFCLTA